MIDNWDYAYDENEEATCRKCKWTGKMKDTKQRRCDELDSRDGYEYSCPRCGGLIQAHYARKA